MVILTVGIDLTKNVFGVDEIGKPASQRPSVARAKLHEAKVSGTQRRAGLGRSEQK